MTKETLYLNGFQYNGTGLDFFPTSEGYVKVVSSFQGDSYYYVFNYTDHLGNIRLRYAKKPSTGAVVILEEDHYYPFGLKQQGYNSEESDFQEDDNGSIDLTPVDPFLGSTYQYKFGGKEYQPELGLEAYDFGARNYRPDLGRWANLDPVLYPSKSPYNAFNNNPVYWIDPSGAEIDPFYGKDEHLPCNCLADVRHTIGGPGDGDVINPNNPVVLDEVVISANRNRGGGNGESFDYSDMPGSLRNDRSSWTSPTTLSLKEYNILYGTDFGPQNPGTTWAQWAYRFHYKPAYDAMIGDMHRAQTYVTLGTLAVPAVIIGTVEAAPFAIKGASYLGNQLSIASEAAFDLGVKGYYLSNLYFNAELGATLSAAASLNYRYGYQLTSFMSGVGVQGYYPSINISTNIEVFSFMMNTFYGLNVPDPNPNNNPFTRF